MEGVKLPIDLDFKLADEGSGEFEKATKGIETSVVKLQEHLNKIMSKINASPPSAPMTKYVASVQKGMTSVTQSYKQFLSEAKSMGKSTDLYADAKANLADYEERLKVLQNFQAQDMQKKQTGDFTQAEEAQYQKRLTEINKLKDSIREYKAVLARPELAALTAEDGQVQLLEGHFEQLKNIIQGTSEVLSQPVKSEQYQALETEATKLTEKLQQYNDKSKDMEEKSKYGIQSSAKSWVELQLNVKKTSSELDSVLRKMRELAKSGDAFAINGSPEAIKELQAQIKSMNATRMNIAGQGQRVGTVENRAPIKLRDIEDGKVKLEDFNSSARKARNSLTDLSKTAQPLKKLATTIGKIAKNILTLGMFSNKTSKSASGLFKKLRRNILMYGLGFRTAYYAIKRLRNTVIEGFTEMASVSVDLNKKMSTFKQSLNGLKGSLATAFQPLLSAILPALTALVNRLTYIMEVIARFNATLTGQNYILKANAKAVDIAAEAQKNATKANKEALGSYDKLDVIKQDNDSDSDDSSKLGVTYTKESLGDGVSAFAQALKDAWEKGDFNEVGAVIGNKLKSILDGIDWSSIQTKASNLGKGIADAINGFFATPDLGPSLGKSIANFIKTGIDFAYNFVTTLEFSQIGQVIADAINGFFETMAETDETGLTGWQKLGESVSTWAVGILDLIVTALGNVEWFAVGQAIGQFIGSIDWGQIVWDFAELARSILKGIADAIAGWAGEDPISAALFVVITAALAASKLTKLIKSISAIFSKIPSIGKEKASGATTTMEEAGKTTDTVSTGTSKLTGKLTSLMKNLALGLVIIAEVAAAALLIVGAIWLLGLMLQQVADAWTPVIENGETVAIAMGIGVGILVAVGVVCALLGSVGTSLIAYLALGIAMLALIGASALLFIAEIWAIGKGLDEIRKAWTPVLDNGDTVVKAIEIGTGILLAVGLVCAALGVLAIASYGLLPIAIGLGTAMLIEVGAAALLFIAEVVIVGEALDEIGTAWAPILAKQNTISEGISMGSDILKEIGIVCAALGVLSIATVGLLPLAINLGTKMLKQLANAFIDFCDSLIKVAKQLNKLAPELQELNKVLPGLESDMDDFTDFMGAFAWAIVKYTKNNAIAGIAATIDKVISFFTSDPIKTLNSDLTTRSEQFKALINTLEVLNPLIEKATNLVGVYHKKMGTFSKTAGNGKATLLGSIVEGAKGVINGIIGAFEGLINGVLRGINFLIRGLNKISFNVPSWVPGIGGKKLGFNISEISMVNIPRLAQGMVVPPNKEFLSILGDNKRETEIVSPLSTMKQAFAEVLAEFGGVSNTPDVNLLLDGDIIARSVWDRAEKRYKQTGKSYGY